MGVEYERKYRCDRQTLDLLDQKIQGAARRIQMHTVYYDTPSGALSQRRYTLRRRAENEKSVCTLKAPIQGKGRGEWEVEAPDILEAVPALLAQGAPRDLEEMIREGLIPVCQARFLRIAKTVSFGKSVLEIALDQGFLQGGERKQDLCEAEVELKAGQTEDADIYAAMLAVNFGLQEEPYSKFRRALALAKGEEDGI